MKRIPFYIGAVLSFAIFAADGMAQCMNKAIRLISTGTGAPPSGWCTNTPAEAIAPAEQVQEEAPPPAWGCPSAGSVWIQKITQTDCGTDVKDFNCWIIGDALEVRYYCRNKYLLFGPCKVDTSL